MVFWVQSKIHIFFCIHSDCKSKEKCLGRIEGGYQVNSNQPFLSTRPRKLPTSVLGYRYFAAVHEI